ncbi:MAG: ricin-type beta-trefoil lectin domain protein [Panacagrimonas sp.]
MNPIPRSIAAAALFLIAHSGPASAATEVFAVSSRQAPERCLQPDKGVAKAGAFLSAKPCSTNGVQKVVFENEGGARVRIRLGGFCVGPTNGTFTDGTRLQLQTCSTSSRQRWIVSDHRLFSMNQPTKVIELLSGNLTYVVVRSNRNRDNQRWDFRTFGAGVIRASPLTNREAVRGTSVGVPTHCLQPDRSIIAVGEKISVKPCGFSPAQTLSLPENANDSIALVMDGLCIGLTGGTYTDGTRPELQKCSGVQSQKWFVQDSRIFPAGARTQSMTVNSQNLNDVILSARVFASNQQWTLPELGAPAMSLGRIMPLGDSITLGSVHGLDNDNTVGGYRSTLEDLLAGAGFSFDFVGGELDGPASLGDKNHEGHFGFRIDELGANANQWLTTQAPDIVLLKIGTNDIFQEFELTSAPGRLMGMIDLIKAARPNATVIVANLFPIQADKAVALNNFNASIRSLIENRMQTDPRLHFVDMNTGFSVADTGDGVHPTPAAYQIIANRWLTAIQNR